MVDQKFEVKGTFLMGEDWMPYTKVIVAPNERQAEERTFAVIGSKHNLKRRYIKVDAIKAV
ncbi:50S ribosomal protein L18Ae [uncultured Methanoregula sp.]|uniref:50S ribosomal protein L18Ae n=1 Tax=uncultured Methanoregula sp. TaxID=1005933 RepID=UPI002AABEFF6|nr:50S ribosomal protein L18Ae [uncultured Methanoregula sp.]